MYNDLVNYSRLNSISNAFYFLRNQFFLIRSLFNKKSYFFDACKYLLTSSVSLLLACSSVSISLIVCSKGFGFRSNKFSNDGSIRAISPRCKAK